MKEAIKNISSEDYLDIKVKGEDRYYLLTATKMETTNELILVINDISSMRKLEDLRKQFVTDVSHEIKTPISVIRAGSETLYSGAINDEQVSNKFLKSILDNSERLSEMVDDLMELEKIEFGGLVLKKEKFNVNNEIQLIFDAQQALLVDKKLSFNNYIGKDIFLFSSILFFASLNLSLYFLESLKESQSFASVLAEISLYLFSSNK